MISKTIKIGHSTGGGKFIEKGTSKCKKITVSYGGGMGGSMKVFYTTKKIIDNETNITIQTIENETIKIYKNFIVLEEDKKLVFVKMDNTSNFNYYKNENEKIKQAIEYSYYETHLNNNIEFIEEFKSSIDLEKEIKRILSYNEIIK